MFPFIMKSEFRRIIASMILFVAIFGLAMSFGEDVVCAGELPGSQEATFSFFTEDLAQIHDSNSPSAPVPPHALDDHVCFGGCNGPCHAPLASIPKIFAYLPFSISLHFADITRHIPEVYLSFFVPPDAATL
jgi:hypothetical protein